MGEKTVKYLMYTYILYIYSLLNLINNAEKQDLYTH